ncbi:MAG: glutathione S-transferase N-terminal domain-containing protein [Rickettsiaceae bacterium]|nr:glutathione S-transferase N-terminal domain-containing protein [Rickettsiaceae bacterium]
MKDTIPILYSFVRCPYAMRAIMALLECRINCIVREVDLRNKPSSMLEISPKGTVPVLILKTRVIDQSLDIVNYALEQNDPFNIQKYTQEKQKEIQELIANNDIEFTKLLRIYKYPERYPEDSQELCKHQIETKFLNKYEKMLDSNLFLFGLKSIADITILPFIRQFAIVDQDWFYNSDYKNIIAWLKLMTNNDDFQNIIMAKHQPWQEFDKLVYLFN